MNDIRLLKTQLFLSLAIILFGIQNYVLNQYIFALSFYETVVKVVLAISVLTILLSAIVLILQSIVFINRKIIIKKEERYLAVNIALYYLVVFTSLYLSTQLR